jgi:group I intron endonuclease
MHYLYKITNTINAKIYIGQTVNPSKRWYAHRRSSAEPKQVIHYAIKKYGNENFEFEVIACCSSQDNCDNLERELIIQYDSRNNEKGYNIEEGGYGGKMSPETKKKISESQKGKKYSLGFKHTEQSRKLMSKKLLGNKRSVGRVLSEETKKKMSDKAKIREAIKRLNK